MIRVFYTGYGFYRRLDSNRIGTPNAEWLHGKNYSLFEHDIETLNLIGRVIIKSLWDIDLEKTMVILTDEDGNQDPFTIVKGTDIYEHENGNALSLIFEELAPLDDVVSTEKPLSERSELSYLLTIGALLEFCDQNRIKQDHLVEWITENYKIHGLGKTSINTKFSNANKALKEKLKE